MSTSEFSKCVTINDSNIPVPKRIHAGVKKSKGCAQLPELQKYIETIIKASNECDSEDASLSDKDRFPKERKFERYTVYKGFDNRFKHEKVKFDLNLTRSKIKSKAKTSFSEAVSSDVEIPNKFVSEFDDPRNWKSGKIQNLRPSLQVEKFLKKLYPNPYHLGSVNDFQNSKTGLTLGKVQKDDLRDGTLTDVVISKVDTESEVDTEKAENALVTADNEIKSSERENNANNRGSSPSFENCNQSPLRNDSNNEDLKDSEVSNVSILNTVPGSKKKASVSKSSSTTSNVSTRTSSLESANELLSKESRMHFKKRKNFKPKSKINSKENLQKVSKCTPLAGESRVTNYENLSDYDIGKLNLLNASDSDDSAVRKFQADQTKIIKNNESDAFSNETNSEISEAIYKSNDLNELLQIYNIMNKATESFLLLNSKNESINTELEVSENAGADKKYSEFLDEPKSQETEPRSQGDDGELKDKDSGPRENDYCAAEEGIKSSISITDSTTENKAEKKPEKEDRKTTGSSLLNILLKEEKYEFKSDVEEKSSDETEPKQEQVNEKTVNFTKNEEDLGKPDNPNDSEQKTELNSRDGDVDANQKIDQVLQFMNDHLVKLNSQEKPSPEEEKNPIQEHKKEMKKTISTKKLSKEVVTDAKHEKPTNSQLQKRNSCHSANMKDSAEKVSARSLSNAKEIQSKHSGMLSDASRKPITRTRYKKKSEVFTPSLPLSERKQSQPTSSGRMTTDGGSVSTANRGPDAPPAPCPDSAEVSCYQTAESHNELGGYSEEPPEPSLVPNADSRPSKPVLPLSVKIKKSTTGIYKTLKDVLETEEKLLANEFKLKKPVSEKTIHEKPKDLITCTPANQILIKNETNSAYSLVGGFKPPSSNFVICVNSFPRNLRTVSAIKPTIPLPQSLSLSLSDMKSWNLKPLTYYPKLRSKKLFITPETAHGVSKFTYGFRQETLVMISKPGVAHTATPVCLKVIISSSKLEEEVSLKKSECQISVVPIKKSLSVEPNIPRINKCCTKSTLTIKSSKSNLKSFSESEAKHGTGSEKPVEVFIEAIEETEEKVFLLERTDDPAENPCGNPKIHPACSCRANETLKRDTAENQWEIKNDKEKVHDLLLRTYNLQQKLHQYLYKMSDIQPAILQCPLIQEPFLNFGIFLQGKTNSGTSPIEFDRRPEESASPFVHYHLQPHNTDAASKNGPKKKDQAVMANVQMVDRSTAYEPPAEETPKMSCDDLELNSDSKLSFSSDREEQIDQNLDDEDDRSSTYSFKSSNDFSETNEVQNFTKDSSDYVTHGKFIKKFFNKIELFKQSFEEDKLGNQQKSDLNGSSNDARSSEKAEEPKENRLVEYDPKTPAKVLKTVFKGRESSTELTIGLKDVPMTKVSNISVEKTKFSPNHTKISICISKEKSNEVRQPSKANKELLPNKFSSYYFDHFRPSLSTCQTEYSRLADDISKSSQSLNEGSEDDEDDYKSAGSAIGNSDTDVDREEKSKHKTQKVSQVSPPKNFTKHRFDFYRKMDMESEGNKTKQKTLSHFLCTYKELEPLKQALTDMQIRMRSIRRDAILNSNDYYERALKLAKMSAGYCQSCGTRAVIPNDTFGYYKTLLPRRYTHHRRNRHFRTTITPNSSFYSFRSSNAEVSDQFCDLDIKHSSSYLLNRTTHSNRTVFKSSLHDMPILFERM